MRISLGILLIATFFYACGNDASTTANETATTPPSTEESKKGHDHSGHNHDGHNHDGHDHSAHANHKYTLTPFAPSAAYPDAKIERMTYLDGKFDFTIAEGSYKLGMQTPDAGTKMCANSAKGQHIHLIVDNGPYMAKYTSSFDDVKLEEGEHYLLAFLSRSYHESIKTDAAHTAQKIKVVGSTIENSEDINEPMLFYSRPKGTYTGKANTQKVMLDFYLANVKLGDNFQVKAEINGEAHMLDTWQPYYIEGLPMGKNTVKLTLLDKEGAMIDTPLNPVEREFTLEADPLETK